MLVWQGANEDGSMQDERPGAQVEPTRVVPEGGGEESSEEPSNERWRDLALFVPRLLRLVGRLLMDPEIPLLDKLLLGAAAAYAASPIDIVPDSIPVLGQLDDLYLIALCLLRLLHRSGEEKLRQHWDGPEDIVDLIHTVTDLATRYLPGRIRSHIRNWVETKSVP